MASGRRWLVLGTVGAVGVALLPLAAANGVGTTAVGADGAKTAPTKRYVVMMKADPLVKAVGADRVTSARALGRAKVMAAGQDAALRAVGVSPAAKVYTYTNALDGFAVDLTDVQASALARQSDVARVMPDVMRHTTSFKSTTSASIDGAPTFMGLTGKDGVWAKKGLTGKGVVVGVIDTGIWPEHPSFRDNGTYPPAPALENTPENPSCNFGNTAFNPLDKSFTCNNKLIGAREFLDTYRENTGLTATEYDSARDDDGHGTHTASTAAGDFGVKASIFGVYKGTVSGVAPRAQIIAYKALGAQGGYSSDLAAAIDQAVADHVDVINYSVGGGASLVTADAIAYLFAADEGIFVATSAGNDGPGDATVGGPASAPWLTAVGANTQPRFFQATLVLGNGKKIKGGSVTLGIGKRRLVDAASKGNELCLADKFTKSVKGAIVLCLRGQNGRAEKAAAVKAAGGVGMVLYNTTDVDDIFTDNFQVPTVMVDNTPGLQVKKYIAKARRATASIVANQKSTLRYAPSMAIFSSRGPDPVAEDIIKPDVTAPGVQVLAGTSPTPQPGADASGQLFMSIAGTSMSSPNVAGLFALIKQAHPEWSPAEAKSALMTTSYQKMLDNDRTTGPTPFGMGSGHVDPSSKYGKGSPFDPGLVYDAGFNDYLGFLCDADDSVFEDPAATCGELADAGIPTAAVDLNYPSIGAGSVVGTQTIHRTVTRVAKPGSSSKAKRWFTAQVKAPKGFSVKVSPKAIALAPGESASFTLTITHKSGPLDTWSYGSLTWNGKGYTVYSPIAVKAKAFSAPSSVSGTGADGQVTFPIRFGFDGSYTATAHGLVPATLTQDSVKQDPDQTFDPEDGESTEVPIAVKDATYLRVAIPPDAVPNPDADLDLYLFDPNGDLVGASGNGGTDEQIDVDFPENGTYTLFVHGWAVPGGGTMDFTLYSWLVPEAGGGSLSVTSAPTSGASGTSASVSAAWSGAPDEWNLGSIVHEGPGGVVGQTLVEVDNR